MSKCLDVKMKEAAFFFFVDKPHSDFGNIVERALLRSGKIYYPG